MTKKILIFALVLTFALPCATNAESKDDTYGHCQLVNTRSVVFASDGGSYIRPIEKATGTVINFENHIPQKQGFVFQGWFLDPRTKAEKVTEVTLNENIVVYAKWLDDGTPKPAQPKKDYATNDEIMAYGNHIDTETGVPVTAL